MRLCNEFVALCNSGLFAIIVCYLCAQKYRVSCGDDAVLLE